jgi:16S rRNA (guanine527-N7)-methyltransferase
MNLLDEGLGKIYPACVNAADGIPLESVEKLGCILEKYIREIELFNGIYSLVSYSSRSELIVKHILDSLAPLPFLLKALLQNGAGSKAFLIADLGSGAGLPGIPLAAALPGCQLTLIEQMERRAVFLENALAILNLSNTAVLQTSCENTASIRSAHNAGYAMAVCRAFHPFDPKLYKSIKRLLAPCGIIALYKGRKSLFEKELNAVPDVCAEILPCHVPFLDEERHLLIIR